MKLGAEVFADWIAADWGTSNLRVWAIDRNGCITARSRSNAGMSKLRPDQFEASLIRLVGDWLAPDRVTKVIACGMVGAQQGWVEAGYQTTPCSPIGGSATRQAPTTDPRISVTIVAGLRQTLPADVMRGEETQIAGLLKKNPAYDGTVCLPGTHNKWARVDSGMVQKFATTMTGELYDLLSSHSVLRHSMSEDWNAAAFDVAVEQAISSPLQVQSSLFRIRSELLLQHLDPSAGRARLSGLLIGQELAALQSWWHTSEITVIGAHTIAALYGRALEVAGIAAKIAPAEEMTLAGLRAIYDSRGSRK